MSWTTCVDCFPCPHQLAGSIYIKFPLCIHLYMQYTYIHVSNNYLYKFICSVPQVYNMMVLKRLIPICATLSWLNVTPSPLSLIVGTHHGFQVRCGYSKLFGARTWYKFRIRFVTFRDSPNSPSMIVVTFLTFQKLCFKRWGTVYRFLAW
jgi:hypothetical protein